MATFLSEVNYLKQLVREGKFALGDGDIKGALAQGGMVTTKQVIEGILDLLGRRSPGGGGDCACWEEVVDYQLEDTGYQILASDMGKLLEFVAISAVPPMEVYLPDPTDLDLCTKVGITVPRGATNVGGPEWAVVVNPLTDTPDNIWDTPLDFRITSPFAPLLGVPPMPGPVWPTIVLGPEYGWFLAEFVVCQPGDFDKPPLPKGWWLKNLDTLVIAPVVPE